MGHRPVCADGARSMTPPAAPDGRNRHCACGRTTPDAPTAGTPSGPSEQPGILRDRGTGDQHPRRPAADPSHGVLPADGQPWITPTQAHRIRTAVARRQSGPRRKHLFTGLCVRIDGQLAQLHPRHRRSGDLAYVFKRADDARQALRPRGTGFLHPLPATVLARWYAEALAGLAMPLSMRLADKPGPPTARAPRSMSCRRGHPAGGRPGRRWQEIDPGADQFKPRLRSPPQAGLGGSRTRPAGQAGGAGGRTAPARPRATQPRHPRPPPSPAWSSSPPRSPSPTTPGTGCCCASSPPD